jgi:hypothetical protein
VACNWLAHKCNSFSFNGHVSWRARRSKGRLMIPAHQRQIDALVYELYELTEEEI